MINDGRRPETFTPLRGDSWEERDMATCRPRASYSREETMPDDVQLVRLRPHTEIEYDGSVESGDVVTDAVAYAAQWRSPLFMPFLYSFNDFAFKRVFLRFVRRRAIG